MMPLNMIIAFTLARVDELRSTIRQGNDRGDIVTTVIMISLFAAMTWSPFRRTLARGRSARPWRAGALALTCFVKWLNANFVFVRDGDEASSAIPVRAKNSKEWRKAYIYSFCGSHFYDHLVLKGCCKLRHYCVYPMSALTNTCSVNAEACVCPSIECCMPNCECFPSL